MGLAEVKLTPEQLPDLIKQLRSRYENGVPGGALTASGWTIPGAVAKRRLHDQITYYRAHFNNLPEVNPQLPKPFDNVLAIQGDEPRRLHGELKSRVTENHFKPKCTPDVGTVTKRDVANDVERLLASIVQELEERQGYTFQEGLADGQIIDGISWLHWDRRNDNLPDMPEYEYLDQLPDTKDKEERKRYRRNREYVQGSSEPNTSRRYRETDESLWERRKHQIARAPVEYHAEVVNGRNVYWVPDRSCLNGMGVVMVIHEVGWLDYDEDNRSRDIKVVMRTIDGKNALHLWREQDGPFPESPSSDGWGERVSIATVWTRDCWYELAAVTHGAGVENWEYITEGAHDWMMPPWAPCGGIEVNDPDPALRYLPALAGVFRLKPSMDEEKTFVHILARNTALPMFYLEVKAGVDLPSMRDANGDRVYFTADAASAMTVPQGYELKQREVPTGSLLPQSLALMREDYAASFPKTGQTDTSASSQPWTVRLKQQEANVTPRKLIDKEVMPLRIFLNSLTQDMTRRALEEPGEMYYRYVEEEGIRELVGVKAVDLKGIEVVAEIEATSAAERVTLAQLGMELYTGGFGLTRYALWDEYLGDQDPQKRLDAWLAEQAFDQFWLPGLVKQELGRVQGTDTIKNVVVGQNGELVGPNGQAMEPSQVNQVNGFTSTAPQVNGQQMQQPGMGPLQAPNTVPIGAGVG